MSVLEYSMQFNSLDRYSPSFVAEMSDRVHQLVVGLGPHFISECTTTSLNPNIGIILIQAYAQNVEDQKRQHWAVWEHDQGQHKRDQSTCEMGGLEVRLDLCFIGIYLIRWLAHHLSSKASVIIRQLIPVRVRILEDRPYSTVDIPIRWDPQWCIVSDVVRSQGSNFMLFVWQPGISCAFSRWEVGVIWCSQQNQ